MRTISAEELQKILEDHKLWLSDKGGKCANLRGADLRRADLSCANLRRADLSGADLRRADLSGANLSYADLMNTNLRDAELSNANLRGASLHDANLIYADLSQIRGIKVAACHWSGHGERGRLLNAVEIGEEIMFFCGCFQGNEQKLRDFIAEGDQAYVASRTKALEFLLSCF